MAIVDAVASILKAIINGIVWIFMAIISCLTCGRVGGGRGGAGGGSIV